MIIQVISVITCTIFKKLIYLSGLFECVQSKKKLKYKKKYICSLKLNKLTSKNNNGTSAILL